MALRIAKIYRYPVKGLTPEPLSRAELAAGEGIPQDRRFALAHGAARIEPGRPQWLPKTNFLMLMRNERLARLKTRFDEATGVLVVERDGKAVARANLLEAAGRVVIEQFFAAFLGAECRGAPRLVESPGHMFSDVSRKAVSIIGLASIRDLERVVRAPVDPRRFRANFYFDGGQPWQEFEWPGKEIRVGGARLSVIKRNARCAATNVDPETGIRDLNIPLALAEGFRHADMGVYAEVVAGGTAAVGDPLVPPP
ncbi:MAG: MOSC domain-containing protein [Pseudomonadota bacterium]